MRWPSYLFSNRIQLYAEMIGLAADRIGCQQCGSSPQFRGLWTMFCPKAGDLQTLQQVCGECMCAAPELKTFSLHCARRLCQVCPGHDEPKHMASLPSNSYRVTCFLSLLLSLSFNSVYTLSYCYPCFQMKRLRLRKSHLHTDNR